MKTLAVRLDETQHAQLSIVAKLQGLTVTDAIRLAIDGWINEQRRDPHLKTRAQELLRSIDEQVQAQKGALEALLGGEKVGPQK